MKLDVLVLQKSMKPGRYKDYLQWNRKRSYSEAHGNICSSGLLGLGAGTMASSYRKMVITTNNQPKHRSMVREFHKGEQEENGKYKDKDVGLSGKTLNIVLEDLEEYWGITKSEEYRKQIKGMLMFMIMEYCGGLRG